MLLDFQNSFVSWKTHTGSYGRFNAEAYLKHDDTEWLLGSQVLAGNVYATENLIKTPLYYFQPVFSTVQCKILRNYFPEYTQDNTLFTPSEQFSEHKVTLNTVKEFKELLPTENIASQIQCTISSINFLLQFPVKHFNVNTQNTFQIETGPIVLPGSNGPDLAYIAFNNYNTFEALIFTNKGKEIQNEIKEFKNCQIKFFTS